MAMRNQSLDSVLPAKLRTYDSSFPRGVLILFPRKICPNRVKN